MRSKKSAYISFDFSEPYIVKLCEMCGEGFRNAASGYHCAVEVRFVAFVCVREERELGDAEDISLDIFHALLPHRARCRVIKHPYPETVGR